MQIDLTPEDFIGATTHPSSCPIANAIDRLFPGAISRVGHQTARVYGITYYLPPLAQRFVKAHDAVFHKGVQVGPISFELTHVASNGYPREWREE